MANENETVENITEKLKSLGGRLHLRSKLTKDEIYNLSNVFEIKSDEILAAHKRELAAKDALIKELADALNLAASHTCYTSQVNVSKISCARCEGSGGCEVAEQIKPDLTLPLKRKWFAKIWNGEKKIEYREVKQYWTRRIGSWPIEREVKFVMFQIGYAKDGPRLLVKVSKVDVGKCPYDGWNGVYYRIHFEIVKPYWKKEGVYTPMLSMPKMKESK